MSTTQPPPENLPPAPLIKRLMALMYDTFILGALSMGYWALATAVMVQLLGMEAHDYQPMQKSILFPLGWLSTMIGFYWLFWKKGGQTIGMRAWRLKVVSVNYSKPTQLSHQQCLIRIVCGPISLFLGGMGYFWSLVNKERATWHDLISRTRVISLPKD